MNAARRAFAWAMALASMGGCASILGVDSDDYINAADVLCDCTREQDACKGQVEGVVESNPEVEQLTLDCLADVGDACRAIYRCVAADYCSDFQSRCANDDNGDPVIACCPGLVCEKGSCLHTEGQPCQGQGDKGGCAGGLSCDAGTCVGACIGPGLSCASGGNCCTGTCDAQGTCPAPECRGLGEACVETSDCCEGECRAVLGEQICTRV